MKIVADNNISYVKDAFAGIGEVVTLPAPELTPQAVADADVVLTRSTVKLGPALLQGSKARFVATATSGVDHVDQPWLASQGIGFASAHGSNANAVAEWFALTLLTMTRWRPDGPKGLTVGVVGVGAVGSRVVTKAKAMGCHVLMSDPPLERAGGQGFSPYQDLLAKSDVLTFHTPLERGGQDPTHHLLNAAAMDQMKDGALVFNASRGAVVSGDALIERIHSGKLNAALDCWEHEPQIEPAHVAAIPLASPHTAGHSLDAKISGTMMVYQAACKALGLSANWDPSTVAPPTPDVIDLDVRALPHNQALLAAVRTFHTHEPDDAMMRAVVQDPVPQRGKNFRAYRRNYRVRREFHTSRLRLQGGDAHLRQSLTQMGFILTG